MGDRISTVDCAAFGILSQIRWHTPLSCKGRQLFEGKLCCFCDSLLINCFKHRPITEDRL